MTRGPKATTPTELQELMSAEPKLSQTELAVLLGVSRQRVNQIITKHKMQKPPRSFALMKGGGSPKRPASRWQTSVICLPINQTVAGTIAEMIAAVDLMTRGWDVFFPLVRTTKCDLLATSRDGMKVIRIEVRAATRVGERIAFNKKEKAVCDHFALVVAGEPVIYEPTLGTAASSDLTPP